MENDEKSRILQAEDLKTGKSENGMASIGGLGNWEIRSHF
jgi:hypothetical protein